MQPLAFGWPWVLRDSASTELLILGGPKPASQGGVDRGRRLDGQLWPLPLDDHRAGSWLCWRSPCLAHARQEARPRDFGIRPSIAGVVGSVGASMFPFILPSSKRLPRALPVWDLSSSHLTLFIMLIAVIVFLPIVLIYTSWVIKVLWGRVTTDEANSPGHY